MKRRDFVKLSALTTFGSIATPNKIFSSSGFIVNDSLDRKRIGIIGLDTSHSQVFTQIINSGEVSAGFKVVAAYPHGSPDIESALKMKPRITEAVKNMGVEIVNSIEELLLKVDYVLLETNDGRLHYEQALSVLKAGKRMFIDKPIAHNLKDAIKIYEASMKYNTPIFSSSALRYEENIMKVKSGEYGKVLGADVYTPAHFDKNHIDMAWYGIHGVEMLFTLLGKGCKEVIRTHEIDTDVITGRWSDGRVATVRGIRKGVANIAGTAFCENAIAPVGPFTTYRPLVQEIINFFESGIIPIGAEETLEIFRFMEAADKSKRSKKFEKLY